MSKGISGLFRGTKGANEASKSLESKAKSQPTYTATESLVHHIINPETNKAVWISIFVKELLNEDFDLCNW